MAEAAGKDVVIKVSGALTPTVGEATTSIAGNLTYQITDETKRVLDLIGVISVQKKGTNDAAEAGTSTTNIKMTAHGLVAGDLICNTSRASAYRLVVTRVDADNITVAAVTSQTTGDVIEVYKTEPATAYSLNRLNGMVTYATNTVRVIKISGNYLPMSVAAYANAYNRKGEATLLESTVFGQPNKLRAAGLKSMSGTLTSLEIIDSVFGPLLAAGTPVVLEDRTASLAEPNRVWAMLEQSEISAAVDGLQQEVITWSSTDAWLKLGA